MYAQHVAWTDHSLMPAPPRSPQLTQHHPSLRHFPTASQPPPTTGTATGLQHKCTHPPAQRWGGYSTGPFCPGLCSPVHCIPGSAVASLRLASLLPTPLGTPPVNPSSSNAKSAREQWENNVRSCDDRGREAYAASNLSSSRWNLQDNRSSPASGRRSCSYHGGHGSSVKHANKVPAKLAAAYVRGRNAKDSDGHRVQYQSVHG